LEPDELTSPQAVSLQPRPWRPASPLPSLLRVPPWRRRSRRSGVETFLGQWLALLRDNGHDTDQFVLNVVDDFSFTMSFGGHVPSQATLQGRGKLFEASFTRQYGKSLATVMDGRSAGGAR
jgi:hypothetical protein